MTLPFAAGVAIGALSVLCCGLALLARELRSELRALEELDGSAECDYDVGPDDLALDMSGSMLGHDQFAHLARMLTDPRLVRLEAICTYESGAEVVVEHCREGHELSEEEEAGRLADVPVKPSGPN